LKLKKVFDKNARKNMNATIVIASIAKQSEDIRWQLIGVYALGITVGQLGLWPLVQQGIACRE
jgi:hypothetical protein